MSILQTLLGEIQKGDVGGHGGGLIEFDPGVITIFRSAYRVRSWSILGRLTLIPFWTISSDCEIGAMHRRVP